MESGGRDKRQAERSTHHFVVRFRQVKPPLLKERWETTTVRDISKTGIFFYAGYHYNPEAELEIMVKNPLIAQETRCRGKVVRCQASEKKMLNFYKVAVEITKVEEPREAYDKTIEFFVKKDI